MGGTGRVLLRLTMAIAIPFVGHNRQDIYARLRQSSTLAIATTSRARSALLRLRAM